MADAAAKEPSMDDILSSIRKIIAEEGHSPEPTEIKSEEPSPVRQTEEAHKNFSEEVFKQASPQPGPQPVPQPVPQAAEHVTQPQVTPIVEAAPVPQAQQNAPAPDMKSIAALMDKQGQEPQLQAAQMERVEMAQATKAPVTPFVAPTPSPDQYQGENRRTDMPMAENSNHVAPVAPAPASVEEVSSFKGALMSPSADNAVSSAFERLKRSTQDDLDATTESLLRPMLREWLDENLPTMVERLIREEIERVARGV